MMSVTTVDFAHFLSGTDSERQAAAISLVDSFKRTGFVKLINHGIPLEVIEKAEEVNKKFFALSPEEKVKAVNPPGPHPQRGWSYKGAETTAGLRPSKAIKVVKPMDEKEHYDIGPADDEEYPNRWLEEEGCPGFKEFSETFYLQCQDLCTQVMAACETGCHISPGTLVNRCKPAASELRYNYYPEVDLKRLYGGETRRGWPHTDFGIITLLFQDNRGGLEYEDRDHPGQFLPIEKERPDEIAINVSDTFQRLSNDVIPAGVHQVWLPRHLTTEERSREDHIIPERHSTVFFFKADRETMVGALPEFTTPATPGKYDDITALEFHKRMTQILVQNATQVPTSA
ncbi:Clavaminate synthase-like protein [Penicillium angulare]|uniref:Clavaminate synthase-like protein n=1 Tax=Penicillium angulare TaxID=116970 RepID=UPI0025407F7A|nr:Clavaminate synthase-like protein [Penicillium angulare]KAJ5260582.1 Clavaminate synthase-like protein [Penicillium angulare]